MTRLILLYVLLLAAFISLSTETNAAMATATSASNDNNDEDDQLMRETIAAGRGNRDAVGLRDQWSTIQHLHAKFDSRPQDIALPAKILGMLQNYRLKCDGCNQNEAIAKINDFVRKTKQHAEQQADRQTWLERAAVGVTVVSAIFGLVFWYPSSSYTNRTNDVYVAGSKGASASGGGVGQARSLKIGQQRRRYSKIEIQEESLLRTTATKKLRTWWDNEEMEVWTPKQEKQFAKALVSFGAVPHKVRYTLLADKVDGKNRQECLMHHKLQQFIAKTKDQ